MNILFSCLVLDSRGIVLTSVTSLIGIGVCLYFYYYSDNSANISTTKPALCRDFTISHRCNSSFVDRIKSEKRQVLILFGSQTGTAEELAFRLAKDLVRFEKKALVLDPEEIDVEELPKIKEIDNLLLILCVSTYGRGGPTTNAKAMYDYLMTHEIDLSGLCYAVFGLGNKNYEFYNAMGRFYDRRLEELGGRRIFELGLGNDSVNLEEDFMKWREAFLPSLAQTFGWKTNTESVLERQYQFQLITKSKSFFKGEFSRIGSYENQTPPFNRKNPFLATVLVNRELHSEKSERRCRHIEFNMESSRIHYLAGDHLGVFPTNDRSLIEKLGDLLGADLDQIFMLTNFDEGSFRQHPFPCPTSFRTALSHYVDICSPVKSHVLRAIAEYATDDDQKQRLLLLSTPSEDGLEAYYQFIQKERRSIVDVLEFFNLCKPPLEYLLELLPRLQARYYSISSSPKPNRQNASITAAVTRYMIGNRLIKGVCTNYLLSLKSGDKCPIFIRRSTFRLPSELRTPVIMIGPGTGYAPFRGFLQERQWFKNKGKEIGEMVLFFGCRYPEHDYIYKEELKQFQEDGVLTHLHLAFSRLTERKIYVQDKIWDDRKHIWSLLQQGAYLYVCGDAKNMERDVHRTLHRVFMEVGGLSEESAQKFFKNIESQRRYQADVWS